MTKKEEPGQLAGFERMAQEFSNRLKREWSNSFCKLWNDPKERYIILKGLLFLWHLLMKQEPFTWKSWRINLVISNISINVVHNYYKMMASTKPGAWILDPFAGSSTTGIAANLLGRRFLGIEKEEEFAAMSKARSIEIERIETYGTFRRKIPDIVKAENIQMDCFACQDSLPIEELPFWCSVHSLLLKVVRIVPMSDSDSFSGSSEYLLS